MKEQQSFYGNLSDVSFACYELGEHLRFRGRNLLLSDRFTAMLAKFGINPLTRYSVDEYLPKTAFSDGIHVVKESVDESELALSVYNGSAQYPFDLHRVSGIGDTMIIGPRGVGKTYLGAQIAEFFSNQHVLLDGYMIRNPTQRSHFVDLVKLRRTLEAVPSVLIDGQADNILQVIDFVSPSTLIFVWPTHKMWGMIQSTRLEKRSAEAGYALNRPLNSSRMTERRNFSPGELKSFLTRKLVLMYERWLESSYFEIAKSTSEQLHTLHHIDMLFTVMLNRPQSEPIYHHA